eukprot:jgi/Mesvir1/5980/Mv00734-RA.1
MVFLLAVVEFYLVDVIVWVSCFSVLGFLKIFAALARDRYERLLAAPSATRAEHLRVFGFINLLLALDAAWMYGCVHVFRPAGYSWLLLLLYEAAIVWLHSLQTLAHYSVRMVESWQLSRAMSAPGPDALGTDASMAMAHRDAAASSRVNTTSGDAVREEGVVGTCQVPAPPATKVLSEATPMVGESAAHAPDGLSSDPTHVSTGSMPATTADKAACDLGRTDARATPGSAAAKSTDARIPTATTNGAGDMPAVVEKVGSAGQDVAAAGGGSSSSVLPPATGTAVSDTVAPASSAPPAPSLSHPLPPPSSQPSSGAAAHSGPSSSSSLPAASSYSSTTSATHGSTASSSALVSSSPSLACPPSSLTPSPSSPPPSSPLSSSSPSPPASASPSASGLLLLAWESRNAVLHVYDFVLDVASMALQLAHIAHILFLHGFALQIIDLVMFLHIRSVLGALFTRVRGFVNYWRATTNLRKAFKDATPQQLADFNDDCAICKERMQCAKVLPCGHLFHLPCLRSWLEQSRANNYTCPTCRCSLLGPPAGSGRSPAEGGSGGAGGRPANGYQQPPQGATAPHVQGDAAGGAANAPLPPDGPAAGVGGSRPIGGLQFWRSAGAFGLGAHGPPGMSPHGGGSTPSPTQRVSSPIYWVPNQGAGPFGSPFMAPPVQWPQQPPQRLADGAGAATPGGPTPTTSMFSFAGLPLGRFLWFQGGPPQPSAPYPTNGGTPGGSWGAGSGTATPATAPSGQASSDGPGGMGDNAGSTHGLFAAGPGDGPGRPVSVPHMSASGHMAASSGHAPSSSSSLHSLSPSLSSLAPSGRPASAPASIPAPGPSAVAPLASGTQDLRQRHPFFPSMVARVKDMLPYVEEHRIVVELMRSPSVESAVNALLDQDMGGS